MTSLSVVGFAALFLSVAAEPAWTPAGNDRDGSYFYDRASVARGDGVVRFRWRANVLPGAVPPIASLTARLEIDCRAQTIAFHDLEAVSGTRAAELKIDPARVGTPRPISIAAGGETLYEALCPGAQPLPRDNVIVYEVRSPVP